MDTFEEVLEHFGVKGMHWGTRKSNSSDVKKARKTYSSDAAEAKELGTKAKKQGSQSLTNTEMRALIQRMQLESQYSQLNTKQKAAGSKFASDLITNLAKQHTTKIVSGVISSQIDNALKKK